MILAIVVAVIIIIAVAVGVAVSRSKKKSDKSAATGEPEYYENGAVATDAYDCSKVRVDLSDVLLQKN